MEEQQLFRQILEDERETENTFDIARYIEDSQEPHTRLIKRANMESGYPELLKKNCNLFECLSYK